MEEKNQPAAAILGAAGIFLFFLLAIPLFMSIGARLASWYFHYITWAERILN